MEWGAHGDVVIKCAQVVVIEGWLASFDKRNADIRIDHGAIEPEGNVLSWQIPPRHQRDADAVR